MQVTVKTLDSETRLFTVSEEATVEEFKNQIASDVSIPVERQRLIFKGKVLQDSAKLQSYGVDGCVIHLVERRPPTQRTHPDGASSERSTSDSHTGDGNGHGFNLTPDVMNLSQQIVQGLVSQLGLNSAQANVSTSQSGDGSTLNVHINLLASANAVNDAGIRISRARQFLRAARNSLNRSEGDNSVLPESSVGMDTSSPTAESQPSTTRPQQPNSESQSNTNPNNTPDVLADVLGELLELNSTVQPYLQRYITLLNSNATENLLPSDDSLPDRVAEALHNISHAYHALSDLTFNFRSPEPRRLNVLPSLSNHVGAAPFLSSLFSGGNPQASQPGQQTPSQGNGDSRIHVVPGPAIAFTSIISGSLPPSGIYNQQPSTTTTGGANRNGSTSVFGFGFGSSSSHGNGQRTSTTSNTTSSSTTPTQSTTQGGGGGENVRIVMDDFMALFSNGQPVTSHSETSRTATPSQQHSQGDTDTQTQNSGNTGASRAVPRINIGQLPLNASHQDPSVPCESFHFGPRSRQPQGTQTEGNSSSQANPGLDQAFNDAVTSVVQDVMGRQNEQTGTSTQPGSTTTSNTRPTPRTMPTPQGTSPLLNLLSAVQNINPGEEESTTPLAQQRRAAAAHEADVINNAIRSSINNAIRMEEERRTQSLHDFLNEVDEAVGHTPDDGPVLEGPFLNRLIDRFGRSMSLQDLIFMMMGLPEPYASLRDVVRLYLLTDLLDGSPATDENIRHVSSQVASELLAIAGELLDRIAPAEDVDVKASVCCFLEDVIRKALTMSRDLDNSTFAARFPDHARQSSTDLCILLALCFRDGLFGATNFVGMRLPFEMTRNINEHMLQTFQATAIQYVETAYQYRPQREEALRQFIKKKAKPEEDQAPASQTEGAETCEANSPKSDDSDAFATPPLSMSVDDINDVEDQDDMEQEDDGNEEWKAVVPEDWVPIIARDVIRQRRLPQQAPFSDAYLSGLPPKRRKTADQRAVSSTSDNMPSILRQAVRAAGVTPKTSMEALATDARQSPDLHEAYRDEVKKAVKRRTSKDTDFNPDRFPSTKDYLEKS